MFDDRSSPCRVAIYYAPDPGSDWWSAGTHWLGRCAASNRPMTQPQIRAVPPAELRRLTAEPRRYGWHATLKAPFQLASGVGLDQLCSAVMKFCRGRSPVELAPLRVSRMDNFLALRPLRSSPALERLAADCVQQLHALAAPLGESELARRRKAGLTQEQDALLMKWGYPWVMQHFRFHLSLTGPLNDVSASAVDALQEAAIAQFHGLPACTVDRLSVFVEPVPKGDFLLYEQFEFQP